MRVCRSGTIVNLSSIGAPLSLEGPGCYSTAKVANEALTLSLCKVVAALLGIAAMVVAPGVSRADFADRSLTQSADSIADYADPAGARLLSLAD